MQDLIPCYARSGSTSFNNALHEGLMDLAGDTAACVGRNLRALVLGGGYGRGEGAVVVGDEEERPYNDLDLHLIVRQKWSVPGARLASVARRHEEALGVEIDFSRPVTLRDVRHWESRLMWHDVLEGHVVLFGPANILSAHAPARVRQPPPAREASRLLLNRGAGLLWAMRVARGLDPLPDPDFIRRNRFKCLLAFGDALLLIHKCYCARSDRREERLGALMQRCPDVRNLGIDEVYRPALRFKQDPGAFAAAQPQLPDLVQVGRQWRSVFLHVERHRHGRDFFDGEAYADWDGTREPSEHGWRKWVRNRVLTRGVSSRYPREALYRRLPRLLDPDECTTASWDQRSADFLDLWREIN